MSNIGYATTAIRPHRSAVSKVKKARKMKITLKQKLRNWLLNDQLETDYSSNSVICEDRNLSSDGMKFELFRASGGYIVETRYYDSKSDRNHNKLYIIKDENDIGEELGKIITMESLR